MAHYVDDIALLKRTHLNVFFEIGSLRQQIGVCKETVRYGTLKWRLRTTPLPCPNTSARGYCRGARVPADNAANAKISGPSPAQLLWTKFLAMYPRYRPCAGANGLTDPSDGNFEPANSPPHRGSDLAQRPNLKKSTGKRFGENAWTPKKCSVHC